MANPKKNSVQDKNATNTMKLEAVLKIFHISFPKLKSQIIPNIHHTNPNNESMIRLVTTMPLI